MSTATAKHVESDSVVSFAGNLWRVETSIEVYCYENEKSSSSKTNEEELVCMMYCTVCTVVVDAVQQGVLLAVKEHPLMLWERIV
jgi:hypothetical protein